MYVHKYRSKYDKLKTYSFIIENDYEINPRYNIWKNIVSLSCFDKQLKVICANILRSMYGQTDLP